MVGAHNALNALAVIAVAEEMDVPLDGGAQRAGRVRRRAAALHRARRGRGRHRGGRLRPPPGRGAGHAGRARGGAFGRRLVVAFQPHRYTRTHDLLAEFATAFNDADVLVVTRHLRRQRGAHSRGHRRGAGRGGPRPRPPGRDLRREAGRCRGGAVAATPRGRPRPHPRARGTSPRWARTCCSSSSRRSRAAGRARPTPGGDAVGTCPRRPDWVEATPGAPVSGADAGPSVREPIPKLHSRILFGRSRTRGGVLASKSVRK